MKKILGLAFCLLFPAGTAFADAAPSAAEGALRNDPPTCARGHDPGCRQQQTGGGVRNVDPPPRPAENFGAIAADNNNAVSAGFGFSPREAVQDALRRCGTGCRILVAGGQGQCVSVAAGKNIRGSSLLFHAAADTAGEAERRAVNLCKEQGHTGCEEEYTVGSTCTGSR